MKCEGGSRISQQNGEAILTKDWQDSTDVSRIILPREICPTPRLTEIVRECSLQPMIASILCIPWPVFFSPILKRRAKT